MIPKISLQWPCLSTLFIIRRPPDLTESKPMPNASTDASPADTLTRSDLEALWLPFTANRQFKAAPRLLARASGMYYWTADGRQILDGMAGLWCVNAGHARREITQAVAAQLETLDYGPTFQMAHPVAFQLANQLVKIPPTGLDH